MKPNGLVLAASITSQTLMLEGAAHQRDLVHQADVDAAEGVLEQLHHLGDLRWTTPARPCRPTARRARFATCGARRASRRRPPSGCSACCSCALPGSMRSGENASAKSSPTSRPRGLERGPHDLFGRARVRRALEDDELARAEVLLDLVDGRDDVGEVRVLRLPQRRRHADVDRVEVADDGEVGRGDEPPGSHRLRDLLVPDVDDVGAAGADGARPSAASRSMPVTWKPARANSSASGKPDVAETDDAAARLAAARSCR